MAVFDDWLVVGDLSIHYFFVGIAEGEYGSALFQRKCALFSAEIFVLLGVIQSNIILFLLLALEPASIRLIFINSSIDFGLFYVS